MVDEQLEDLKQVQQLLAGGDILSVQRLVERHGMLGAIVHPDGQQQIGVAELGYDKFIVRAPKNNTSKNAELMQCPECQSTHVNKNGHKKGKQNYICVGCGRQFIDCYQPHKGYSWDVKRECLKMYVNGLGFRAIERIKGVHHTTIINWVKQVGPLLPDTYEAETIPEVAELDELETFVGQKK